MGETEAFISDPKPSSPRKKPSLCEECGSNPWKYRCPGCSILSCSLPCVNSHKARTGCTGKRSLAQVVPLSQFNDNLLLSDYNLLEDTKRVAEAAQRTIVKFGSNYYRQWPRSLRMLHNAAYRRRTRLWILPMGMSKREKNQSHFSERRKCIYWTLEFRFHSTDVVVMDHKISEYKSLSSVIEKHLTPSPWNNKLRSFGNVGLDDLKFFIRKTAKGAESRYRQLNVRAPIGKQLKGILVIEYPVIHVLLPSHTCDFEVEAEGKLSHKTEESSVHLGSDASPKGTLFREEEIEEGEMVSDTKVVDLMDHGTSYHCNNPPDKKSSSVLVEQIKHQDKRICRDRAVHEAVNTSGSHKQVAGVGKCDKQIICGSTPMKLSQDEKFDFEQEIKDAYSDLLGEINPDDFLCLDDGFSDNEELQEYASALGEELLKVGELEEGEIPSD